MAGKSSSAASVKGKKRRLPIVPLLGILVGLCILAYPIVTDLYETWLNSQAISSMTATADDTNDPTRLEALAQAHAYNERLAGNEPSIASGEIWPYEQQLKWKNGDGIAWVEIPNISVQVPVYRGTGDAALSAGVGHLENTSLPVGGASTHTVLTGHSGMYNNRMFDDIRNMEVGDLFAVHTLGDEYVYEVDSIEVVWPNEVDSLNIEPGADRCTLVTCTPYGVNDHRLLVHAVRTGKELVRNTPLQDVANYVTNMRVLPFIAGLLAALLAIGAFIWRRKRRQRLREEQRGRQEQDSLKAPDAEASETNDQSSTSTGKEGESDAE